MSIIYKTTNLINGKIYVGQHWTSANDGYLGSGKVIELAIKKYGKENFKRETLEYCTLANINEREIYWIEALSARNSNIGYNIVIGGNGTGNGKNNPMYGKHHTNETKNKISESISGKNNPMYGKLHTDETRKKMKENHANISGKNNPNYRKIFSEKTKRKMSEANMGKVFSKETKQKLSEARRNRIISDDTKRKISQSLKGRILSEDWKRKLSESKKRVKPSEEIKKRNIIKYANG